MKRREFLKFSAAASAVIVAGLQSECISKEVVATQNPCDFRERYISPETVEDIMNWSVDCMDEYTRKEMLTSRR